MSPTTLRILGWKYTPINFVKDFHICKKRQKFNLRRVQSKLTLHAEERADSKHLKKDSRRKLRVRSWWPSSGFPSVGCLKLCQVHRHLPQLSSASAAHPACCALQPLHLYPYRAYQSEPCNINPRGVVSTPLHRLSSDISVRKEIQRSCFLK